MSSLTRRSLLLLLGTASVAAGLSLNPKLAISEPVSTKSWQDDLDAVFAFFDRHHFSPAERGRALNIEPADSNLSPEDAKSAIEVIARYQVPRMPRKQDRVRIINGINASLFNQHGDNLAAQQQHLYHQWSLAPEVSVLHLMTTRDLDDLHTAGLCAQVHMIDV